MKYLLDTNIIIDAIIAATAMEVGAVLVTRNESDFKKIDGLQVFNPWVS